MSMSGRLTVLRLIKTASHGDDIEHEEDDNINQDKVPVNRKRKRK